MASLHSLCCLCGNEDVCFLLVEKFPEWLASPKIRGVTGNYRVEPFCALCVRQPQAAGGWIVAIHAVGPG